MKTRATKHPSVKPPTTEERRGDVLCGSGQVAYTINVTIPHVHKLANGGVIPFAHRSGRCLRFHLPTVLEALAENAKQEEDNADV